MSLGRVIRRERERRGLTLQQVAHQAGISKPYLSNIETGRAKHPPSDPVLRRLEQGLGFAPNELVRLAHLARTPLDVRQELFDKALCQRSLAAEVERLRGALKQLIASRDAKGTSESSLSLEEHSGKALLTDGSLAFLPKSLFRKELSWTMNAGTMVPIINYKGGASSKEYTSFGFLEKDSGDMDDPVGFWAQEAEEFMRLPDLHEFKAFAIRVLGDSMAPKYAEGDIVVFLAGGPSGPCHSEPFLKFFERGLSDGNAGDDCFVQLTAGEKGRTTFRRVYRDGDGANPIIRLQPLNPRYPSESCQVDQVKGLWPAVLRVEWLRRDLV